jgi:hypothetical protein
MKDKPMKKISLSIITVLLVTFAYSQQAARLIVRADDMGVTHATNLACIDAFTKGIARSVEVMVPRPGISKLCNFCSSIRIMMPAFISF